MYGIENASKFYFNKNAKNLEIIVGNFKDIILKEKYDYILLNGVFEYVEEALFVSLFDEHIDDGGKSSLLRGSAEKLRIIGKILKTQKAWRASDEFKEGFRETRDELMSLFKKDKKAVLKKLFDMGVINSAIAAGTFDKRSRELYDELVRDGIIQDVETSEIMY